MPAFWTEVYQRHFVHYFNKPFDVQVYRGPDGMGLKLATHDWIGQSLGIAAPHTFRMPHQERASLTDFRVYASIGLADILFRNEAADFGEVILYCDTAQKDVPQLFVNALFFIAQNEIPLGSRFAIGFGAMGERIARRFDKSAFYFTRPAGENDDFRVVEKGEAEGQVFQAYFIAPEEHDFLEQHGAEAFEREFWKQFDDRLSEDEKIELMVDKEKHKDLDARMQQMAGSKSMALSISRPSCV